VRPFAKTCAVVEVGLISYATAYALQRRLVAARKTGEITDILLLCEHPHIITLGRNAKREHLLASDRLLASRNVELHESDRGGDITYHGPGQIVGYPILDLTEHRRDVRWYVEMLEEVMIRASADFGVTAQRVAGRHGLWVDTAGGEEEKLAAIGVHLSRWVTSHGFAYNVSTDLHYFDLIVPCGISGKRATSLKRLLNRAVRAEEVKSALTVHFGDVFECETFAVPFNELEARLSASAPAAEFVPSLTCKTETSAAGVMSGD